MAFSAFPPGRRSDRSPLVLLFGAATLGFLAACASSGGSFVPTTEEMPVLEDRIRSSPDDADLLARLGAGYRADGRLAEAAGLLERARTADPSNSHAALFLGLTYEDQERYGEAMELYTAYMELGPPADVEKRMRARVRLLHRRALRQAVRESLAREAELAGTAPEPRTVGVFPFVFIGQDESLRPLGRAMAEMLTTDLSQTDRLTVLERVHVQVLLDEIALGESDLVDPASAARPGRILGAGRIVQGQITGDQARLGVEAAVVNVDEAERMAPVSREDVAGRLFTMEKELAFEIYEAMGVSLTATERQAVNQRFTENLQALLAFGRGLEASDAGRYDEARRHFQAAVELDPDFEAARSEAQETEDLAAAESTTTSELAEAGIESTAASEVDLGGQIDALSAAAGRRDPAQEALGTEGVAATGTAVEIIFRRPSGGDR